MTASRQTAAVGDSGGDSGGSTAVAWSVGQADATTTERIGPTGKPLDWLTTRRMHE